MPFFNHDSVSLFYTIDKPLSPSNTEPPYILLLHGFACDSHDWSHQIPYLQSLNLGVIALDHRGHGRSTCPSPATSTSYSMRTFVADALALLTHLNISKVLIMAHSMGTVITSLIAAEHPEIVQGVIYVHPIYSGAHPALITMSQRLRLDPSEAPDLTADFFRRAMYTANTPEWLKCYHVRRVLGGDEASLAGCYHGMVELFDSVVGQNEVTLKFMRSRKGPKLVFCTNSVPGADEWEVKIGQDEGGKDEIISMQEGTFSHVVLNEQFNGLLGAWLKKNGFVGK